MYDYYVGSRKGKKDKKPIVVDEIVYVFYFVEEDLIFTSKKIYSSYFRRHNKRFIFIGFL